MEMPFPRESHQAQSKSMRKWMTCLFHLPKKKWRESRSMTAHQAQVMKKKRYSWTSSWTLISHSSPCKLSSTRQMLNFQKTRINVMRSILRPLRIQSQMKSYQSKLNIKDLRPRLCQIYRLWTLSKSLSPRKKLFSQRYQRNLEIWSNFLKGHQDHQRKDKKLSQKRKTRKASEKRDIRTLSTFSSRDWPYQTLQPLQYPWTFSPNQNSPQRTSR